MTPSQKIMNLIRKYTLYFFPSFRVTALVQGDLVLSLEFSMMPTPVWILLRGFSLDQPTPLAVLNATPPPLQLQSKRSLIESILMSVARG